MMTTTEHIYTLRDRAGSDFYVGRTQNPTQRLQDHILQAIEFYSTDKDRFIYDELLDGTPPTIVTQFHTTPLFAPNDETFTMWAMRDIFELPTLNVTIGHGHTTLSTLKDIPKVSKQCAEWYSLMCGYHGITPTVKPIVRPQSGSVNTVSTQLGKKTIFYIEVTRTQRETHKFGGPDTQRIWYKWLNTNIVANRNKEHSESYIDSLHIFNRDLQPGEHLFIETECIMAPDNPNSKMWSWANWHLIDPQKRATQLADRLLRLQTMRDLYPNLAKHLDIRTTKVLTQSLRNLDNYVL